MTDEENLIERALNVSSACLLPALREDCDAKPISPTDFNEFRMMLNDQLHLLLDILYHNENLLKSEAFDNQLVLLRVNIFLITCEQTEPNQFFQTDQKILIDSLARLAEDNLKHFNDAVTKKVIQVYKDGLQKDCWKKQFGLIHGFPKFCEIMLKEKPESFNADIYLFILSVGSNLVLHYDPNFKTIGLKIYRTMLEHGDKNLLKELNIHQVVYSESFNMMRKSSEPDFNEHLYECLFQAVKIEEKTVKTSRWCKFDDVLQELLTQLCSESDLKISLLLLNKLMKFCGIIYDGLVMELPDGELDQLEHHYKNLMLKASKTNYRTMRWIKRLLQVMVTESSKLLSDSTYCFKFIHGYHSIYILTMFNTESEVLGQQLIDYTKKIIFLLMQVARKYKDDKPVMTSLVLFLKTIAQHQRNSPELLNCIEKILNHEAFKI